MTGGGPKNGQNSLWSKTRTSVKLPLRTPTPSCPIFLGFGPHPSGSHGPLGAPTFSGFGLATVGPPQFRHVWAKKRSGPKTVRPGRSHCQPVATDENKFMWEFYESWRNHEDEVTVKPFAHKTATGKPVASSNSENSGNPKAESRKWLHNLHTSPAVVPRMETVFSIVRKIYDREPTDNMDDLDVNAAIWGIFLNTFLRAAVHLGQDHAEFL